MIKNVKNTVPWTYCILLVLLIMKFRVEKLLRQKAINYMLNGKFTIILLTVGFIETTWYN